MNPTGYSDLNEIYRTKTVPYDSYSFSKTLFLAVGYLRGSNGQNSNYREYDRWQIASIGELPYQSLEKESNNIPQTTNTQRLGELEREERAIDYRV